jgi:excisionase family DNA binding protein
MTTTPVDIHALAVELATLLDQQAPPLLDAAAAAALLSVPASWVLGQARKDRIPHVKLGRYTRFRRADLDQWLDRRRA